MAMQTSKLVDTFLAWCQKNRAANTELAYRYHLTRWLKFLGDLPIDDLKPIHLSSWASSWHEVQAVQRLLQFAKDDMEIVSRNVFSRVQRPPLGQRRLILSPMEMTRFIRNAQPHFRQLLITLRATMARPQEVRALRFEHLRSEDSRLGLVEALLTGKGLIVMQEYKSRKQRKDANAPRVLLVNRRLGRLIVRRIRERQIMTGHIFLNKHGRPYSNNAVRCAMKRLRKKALPVENGCGENVVCYSFRHSQATEASAAGIRDRTLAELLGHTSTRTTARYQHLNVKHLRNAIERMEKH